MYMYIYMVTLWSCTLGVSILYCTSPGGFEILSQACRVSTCRSVGTLACGRTLLDQVLSVLAELSFSPTHVFLAIPFVIACRTSETGADCVCNSHTWLQILPETGTPPTTEVLTASFLCLLLQYEF